MTGEALEKAAIAAAEHYGFSLEEWNALPEQNPINNGELDKHHFRECAAAVLRSFRNAEHSAGLVAGKNALYCCTEDPELEHARACLHAMIDAALVALIED